MKFQEHAVIYTWKDLSWDIMLSLYHPGIWNEKPTNWPPHEFWQEWMWTAIISMQQWHKKRKIIIFMHFYIFLVPLDTGEGFLSKGKTSESCVAECFLGSRPWKSIKPILQIFDYHWCIVKTFHLILPLRTICTLLPFATSTGEWPIN